MPLAEEWTKLEQELGSRPLLQGSAEEMIQQYNGLIELLTTMVPPPDTSVNREDKTVGEVGIRIYTPPGAEGKKLPIGVYTHGGGFICGDLNGEDALACAISKNTPAIMVSVDYRLGPKHKQPTMINDSYEILKWTYENADSLGGDVSKLFTVGGSAGGGLALCLAEKALADGKDIVKGIVSVVPLTIHPENVPAEHKDDFKAYTENATDVPIIDKASMDEFYRAVEADKNDPAQFVSLSKNLAKFPPTYVAVCGHDPLRDDGIIIEKMLRSKGVKTKIDSYPDYPHYFWIFPQISEGQKFAVNLLTGVQFVLGNA